MATHVSELPLAGSIESSLRQAITDGMLADSDLATDLATVLTNIATRNAKIIAGQRPDLYPKYLALKAAIEQGFRTLGATTMITDTATIYAAIEQTWPAGFGVAV